MILKVGDRMSFNDRELLARMVQCEAGGEGEDGMKAVATVIMNRVRASGGEYLRTGNGSLQRIVMQPGQLDCAMTVKNGQSNSQNIYNMSPEPINYDIADWALAGNIFNPVGDCLWFYNPFSGNCRSAFPGNSGTFHIRINNHCFYRPTPAYYDT